LRGFRTSTDLLRKLDSYLAEKFARINRDLEALTTSGYPRVSVKDGEVDAGDGMNPFGQFVVKQRNLVKERDRLIFQIQASPGFETFMKAPSFDILRSSAADGPVIIINHCRWRSDIIIILYDRPPSLILTTDDFYDRAIGLRDQLLAARKKGLDSEEYNDALSSVLAVLYNIVGKPVIEKLRELNVPEQSRIWWCPTSVLCSLPLHAMGPIRSDGRTKLYFSDLYIPSYTPTLSALMEAHRPGPRTFDKPSILLVVQPDANMPNALQEMRVIQTVTPSVTTLLRGKAKPTSALEHLRNHQFAHFSCHGKLEKGKPFEASFKLYKGARLTLLDFVRSQLRTAEFAFLSACHTAELTEESIADEGLHLTAAVQYCRFRSVVGTMWEMADIDGPGLAGNFYRSVFSDRRPELPYYERTAEALRDAVRNLRRKRNITLERWVNFVHYGA
jgi:CHAT domain-containing protein